MPPANAQQVFSVLSIQSSLLGMGVDRIKSGESTLLSYILDYTVTPPHNLLCNRGGITDCTTHADDTEPWIQVIILLMRAIDLGSASCQRGGKRSRNKEVNVGRMIQEVPYN